MLNNIQNQYDIEIDLYFWMIDSAEMQDDQRNYVDIENQIVRLHREQAKLLLCGYIIGRIMTSIRKLIIKKTK